MRIYFDNLEQRYKAGMEKFLSYTKIAKNHIRITSGSVSMLKVYHSALYTYLSIPLINNTDIL